MDTFYDKLFKQASEYNDDVNLGERTFYAEGNKKA